MIAYRDFQPESAGFLPGLVRIRDQFNAALAEANRWIESESVDVLNVETLGTAETQGRFHSIRVWYRSPARKPGFSPEI